MSYCFQNVSVKNITCIRKLIAKYHDLSREYQEKVRRMQAEPKSSRPISELLKINDMSVGYTFVYNTLNEFRPGQSISDLEFNALKKTFSTYENPDLMTFLETAFVKTEDTDVLSTTTAIPSASSSSSSSKHSAIFGTPQRTEHAASSSTAASSITTMSIIPPVTFSAPLQRGRGGRGQRGSRTTSSSTSTRVRKTP